jgi:predicted CoA-binding protein
MQLTTDEALELIKSYGRVAVVGLSPKTDRPSNRVGKFLIEKGFNVTPVNPANDEILGQKGKRNLAELKPGDADWIDMFVNKDRLMDFLDDIIRLSPKLVWCQIGVVNEAFNKKLEEEKIPYISDVCPKQVWK